jgi:Ni,Fe-hydrogenase I large subunit
LRKCGDILKVISDFVNKNVQEDLSIIEQYYGIELSRDDGIRNFLSFGLYNEYPEVKISDDLYIMGNNRGIPEYKDMVEDDTNFYNPECSIYNFIKAPKNVW